MTTKQDKPKSDPALTHGNPWGGTYQEPSRPYEEMAEPGSPPEVDEDVEKARKFQREEIERQYKPEPEAKSKK